MTAGPGAAPNNFALLRLLAAAMVILGHSYVIVGAVPPRLLGVEVHVLGVHVFFAISGYLITASWQSDPSLWRYAARRVLRIMPALLAVVALSMLVLGPLLTTASQAAYWGGTDTWLYLWNAALAPYYTLPGVFQDGRPFTAVNGSLWTLPIEAAMYALVPLLAGRAAVVRWGVLPVAVLAACGAAYVFTVLRPNQVQPVVWWNSIPFGLRFAGDFALGALVRSWRLEPWLRLWAAALGVALLALASAFTGAQHAVAAGVLLAGPYAVLALGLAAPVLPAPRADVSYGLYLWGCPVQQALLSAIGLGRPLDVWLLTAAALGLAGLIGLASWLAIERPALQLKPMPAHR